MKGKRGVVVQITLRVLVPFRLMKVWQVHNRDVVARHAQTFVCYQSGIKTQRNIHKIKRKNSGMLVNYLVAYHLAHHLEGICNRLTSRPLPLP